MQVQVLSGVENAVITGFSDMITLGKTTNKTGQPYALYNFEAAGTLSPEEAATAKAFGQKFIESINYEPEQNLVA